MSPAGKFTLLASLYLAQGLPYGFFTQALPVLLREQGLSLKAISGISILFLPWALKFLWAPWVDGVGTRRQWLIPLQLAAVLLAMGLSQVDFLASLKVMFVALLLFNLIAATQDIATDGLAVQLLGERERGWGNGIQVGAYRVGMILGGGLLLWVFARMGSSPMFLAMGSLLLLSSLPLWFLREPPSAPRPPRVALGTLAVGWLARLRLPGMAGFIGLLCFYKFGDSMIASLAGPFMKDTGMSTESIALVKGTLGSGVTLAGAALGGWMAWRLGRRAALLTGGLAQAGSLVLYVVAAHGFGGENLIIAASTAEHLLGGIATVALFTLMMDACDKAHASTDYTLLACAVVVAHGTANFCGAALADAFGYAPMFSLGLLLAVAGTLTLVRQLDQGRGPQPLGKVWKVSSTS